MKTFRDKIFLISALILSLICYTFIIWFWFFSFPDELNSRNSSVSIQDRNGIPLREVLSLNDGRSTWVELPDISPYVIKSTLRAEDKRFRNHSGIDPYAVLRAFHVNLKHGKVLTGGSTITQQLIRIIRPQKREYSNKLLEAIYAIRIEKSLLKDQILENYLNRAPYGNQFFGISAAAWGYFRKPAKDLSLAESAYLSILPRAPSSYNPYKNPEKISKLFQKLLKDLFNDRIISKLDYDLAKKTELKISAKTWPFKAPHLVEMLPEINSNKIKTTIDISLQEKIETIIENRITPLEKYNVTNAAAIVVDNKTGEILSLVGSVDYYNKERDGNVNGATALRQPGSALKPFTYILALENGYSAASILPDIETHFATTKGDYSPKNYDLKYRGPVRLRIALANSLNVPAVYILSQLGPANLLKFLQNIGFKSLDQESGYYGLGLTLGNGEVKLLELAQAYSTLARLGIFQTLHIVLNEPYTNRSRFFSKETAYIISDILSDDESRRMTFGDSSPLSLPFPVAAKTGTSKNFRDNWTIGYTPEFTVGVWVGNFDASAMHGISGITGAGPIFRDIFIELSKRHELTWFQKPKKIVSKKICPFSGKILNESCSTGIDEIFIRDTEPLLKCSYHNEDYLDLPYIYHDWALTHNIQIKQNKILTKNSKKESTHQTKKIRIIHPNNNSIYAIDPDIPINLQNLFLTAIGDDKIEWFIDGEKKTTTTPSHKVSWPLKRGKHTIKISSRNNSLSDEVTITVY